MKVKESSSSSSFSLTNLFDKKKEMSLYRCFSTARTVFSQGPPLSGIVKQLSKFSSYDELVDYSQRPIEYCYPYRMIETCSTPVDLIQMANDLHNQLLVRIAHCLNHFQSIPFLPGVNPTLLALHERYLKSFEQLAHLSKIKSSNDEENFFQLIQRFVQQYNDAIGLLSTGCSEAEKYFKSYKTMKDFLDNVLKIRLSMRLLAEHYIELHKQQDKNTSKSSSSDEWRGAICMSFSPSRAVQQCVDDVSSICFETYTVVPHVEIENHIKQPLPFFPHIVEYILRELLKNSMRAIVEYNKNALGNIQQVKKYFQDNQSKALCKVILTADPQDEHFTIAVKDYGGGIDEADDKIFRYMFSGITSGPKLVLFLLHFSLYFRRYSERRWN